MPVDEAPSGTVLGPHFQKEMRQLVRKYEGRLAEKQYAERKASRVQLQREEKQRARTKAEASLVNLVKTQDQTRS